MTSHLGSDGLQHPTFAPDDIEQILRDEYRKAGVGQSETSPEHGQLFFFSSGKGGVGKSLIAANLAVAIASETKNSVVLVDLDLKFGDVGVLLNLDHSRGITDLLESADHIDASVVREAMVDGPAGLKVLLGPLSPEVAAMVNVDGIRRIFHELRKLFDYIVVDSSVDLADFHLEVLRSANTIVVVTSLSLPAIKNTKLMLRNLDALSISPERVALVLNKSDAHAEFTKESVETNLRFPVAVVIPNDPRLVIYSVNRGSAFVSTHPQAQISEHIRQLVGRLLATTPGAVLEQADKNPRKGLFARR